MFGFNFADIPDDSLFSFALGLIIMGMSTALGLPSRAFESLLLAQEKHWQVGFVESLVQLARLVVLYTVLSLGGGLVARGRERGRRRARALARARRGHARAPLKMYPEGRR